MRIKKNARGWTIEPSTSDEEKALAFLLDALEQAYSVSTNSDRQPDISGVVSVANQ